MVAAFKIARFTRPTQLACRQLIERTRSIEENRNCRLFASYRDIYWAVGELFVLRHKLVWICVLARFIKHTHWGLQFLWIIDWIFFVQHFSLCATNLLEVSETSKPCIILYITTNKGSRGNVLVAQLLFYLIRACSGANNTSPSRRLKKNATIANRRCAPGIGGVSVERQDTWKHKNGAAGRRRLALSRAYYRALGTC